MREIKFRAWTGKKMFDVDVLAVNPVTWDSSGTGVSLAYQPHIKVMQYTGLKDKNGREIYEGDIIRDNETYLWETFFGDGMFGVKGGEFGMVEALIEFVPEHCEVIGNIFQNGGLLNDS